MRAEDVTDTLEMALTASGCDQARVQHKPRLLSDNGCSYLSGDLAEWLEKQRMDHTRGAPYHPQTQGKIERWHQTLKNRILLELEQKKADLTDKLAAPVPAPYPSLHPNLAALYRKKVEQLEVSLNEPEIRMKAADILRTIIDRIEVGPINTCDNDLQQVETRIVLYGQLAAVMALAEGKDGIENKGRLSCVAGTRYPLYRKTLWLRRGQLTSTDSFG